MKSFVGLGDKLILILDLNEIDSLNLEIETVDITSLGSYSPEFIEAGYEVDLRMHVSKEEFKQLKNTIINLDKIRQENTDSKSNLQEIERQFPSKSNFTQSFKRIQIT